MMASAASLTEVLRFKFNIVSQVIETELIVGSVSNVSNRLPDVHGRR